MNAKQYVREIIQRSCLPVTESKRIKNDLENEIASAMERGESIEQVMERMGDPDEVAAGIYENSVRNPVRPFREYKSKRTLFGLPLVHIIRGNYSATVPQVRAIRSTVVNVGGRYGVSQLYGLPTARGVFAFGPRAKGIVAVGNLAAGLISLGNLSTGVLSVGNLSIGLFSIGNLSLALLIALGNVAVGALAAGNLAVGYGAAGNAALGRFAVGNEVAGRVTFTISDLSAQLGQVKAFFAGLNAPYPVKVFFGFVEKALEILNDPVTATPLLITLTGAILAVTLALCIVPNRLLTPGMDNTNLK